MEIFCLLTIQKTKRCNHESPAQCAGQIQVLHRQRISYVLSIITLLPSRTTLPRNGHHGFPKSARRQPKHPCLLNWKVLLVTNMLFGHHHFIRKKCLFKRKLFAFKPNKKLNVVTMNVLHNVTGQIQVLHRQRISYVSSTMILLPLRTTLPRNSHHCFLKSARRQPKHSCLLN
jgi:hypothetical protein